MPDVVDGLTEPLIRISCPDCFGVLEARADGPRRMLVFVCRVGHTYSVIDLLTGKEDHLESRLWSALNVTEEVEHLFAALGVLAEQQALHAAAASLRARSAEARAHAARLREIVEANRAIAISDEATRIHAGNGA